MMGAEFSAPPRPVSSPCGLFLSLPRGWSDPDFLRTIPSLFRAINASKYEKNAHILAYDSSEEGDAASFDREALRAVCSLAQSQGIVFLCMDDVDLCAEIGADGVLVQGMEAYEYAREKIGESSIVGVRCGVSRLLAEKALQAGADCVSFNNVAGGYVDSSFVEGWYRKTDKPCIVETPIDNETCAFYVQAGASFINAGAYIWRHPKGVMQGVVNIMYAIDFYLGYEKDEEGKKMV